jgi:23S rRNA (guanosine2251-2'-O)-methyltransferase
MSNLIYGKQPVLEALKSETPIEKVFVIHGLRPDLLKDISQLAKRRGIPIVESSPQRFREFEKEAPTQGVVAQLPMVNNFEIEDLLAVARKRNEPPFILVLDEIVDPQNLGALIRTAECAGVHGVVIPKHNSVSVTETVAKTSAGASFHVPLARVTNLSRAIEDLKSDGIWVIGLDMDGEKLYHEMDFRGPLALVVGSEGKGIRRLVKESCDFLIRIPMYGKIGSLNASVSGAIAMFEAAKSRHTPSSRTDLAKSS